MNFVPRQAVIVAQNTSEAELAEATVASKGFLVSRFESTDILAKKLESLPTNGSASGTPDVAILIGSTAELASATPNGVDAISKVMPVVVTSTTATVSDAVELMKHGVKDVVELPCDGDELWQRIQNALSASEAESACKSQMAEMRARLELLTPAENEVVDALLDGLANKQIAQRLGIGLRTVELRRSKIMRKMQAKSVAELVKFICMSGKLRPKLQQQTT